MLEISDQRLREVYPLARDLKRARLTPVEITSRSVLFPLYTLIIHQAVPPYSHFARGPCHRWSRWEREGTCQKKEAKGEDGREEKENSGSKRGREREKTRAVLKDSDSPTRVFSS